LHSSSAHMNLHPENFPKKFKLTHKLNSDLLKLLVFTHSSVFLE